MTALFYAFLALMVVVVVALVARYLSARTAVRVLSGLCAWLIYAGLLGYLGVLKNTSMRPPGIVLLLGPILLSLTVFCVFILWFPAGARIALAVPLWIIVGVQSFRIGVELFLHQLWIGGLVPKMLTFAGANVDIYFGASAPLIAWLSVAWLSTRGRIGLRVALAWNLLGLVALANVVVRAVLTAPGPLNLIRSAVPDRMISTFPFLFIPAFFVQLAVMLHVLAIRAILSRQHEGMAMDAAGRQRVQAGAQSASV